MAKLSDLERFRKYDEEFARMNSEERRAFLDRARRAIEMALADKREQTPDDTPTSGKKVRLVGAVHSPYTH